MSHGVRSRNICFTSWDALQLDPSNWPHCTFATWQMEMCPDTYKLHWQGYMELDTQVPWSTLHTYDGFNHPPAHFEIRRGSQKDAIGYCTKEDTRVEGPWTWGEPKQQGQNAQLILLAADLRAGRSVRDIAVLYPAESIKHPMGIAKMQLLVAKQRPDEVKTVAFVFYGAGGTGKSTFALKLARYLGDRVFRVPSAKGSGLYWDGYQQGDVVIIDEFKGNRMQPTEFNQLIDCGPHQVPVHGGTTEFNSKYVLITTNVTPEKWWDIEFKRSLRRRIVLWPIFRNLGYKKPKVNACIYCLQGLCAFHHI